MTQTCYYLPGPDDLLIRANARIFWVENQAVVCWEIPREALAEPDPPVVVTWSGESGWEARSELDGNPVTRISPACSMIGPTQCLRRAAHGRLQQPCPHKHQQIAWLEEASSKAKVTPACFEMPPEDQLSVPTLSICEGLAVQWVWRYAAVAGQAEGAWRVSPQALQCHLGQSEGELRKGDILVVAMQTSATGFPDAVNELALRPTLPIPSVREFREFLVIISFKRDGITYKRKNDYYFY